jgi:hypothetical protein
MSKPNIEDIKTVVLAAIAFHIGSIAGLPEAAQTRIHEAYTNFFRLLENIGFESKA